MTARWALVIAALVAAQAGSAQEQGQRVECKDDGWNGNRQAGARVCEIREFRLQPQGRLSIDAGANGGIEVNGENRRDVQVRARVEAWASDEAEAERIASEVVIRSDDGVRAEGPSQRGRTGWNVSYEVLAPREIDLALETSNGGIAVADISGDLDLEARNGGISVAGLGGNVRGRTTNGGVEATLTGKTWEGAGLDLQTTNGGVRVRVPDDYSARLETRTVNGSIDVGFPVTVQGRIGRELTATLGDGGPLIRAVTTNGGVRVSRR